MLLMWDPLLQKAEMQCTVVCNLNWECLRLSLVVVCLSVTLLALICALNTSLDCYQITLWTRIGRGGGGACLPAPFHLVTPSQMRKTLALAYQYIFSSYFIDQN